MRWTCCGKERPPSTDNSYTDCGSVGKVVTAQDPPRDVTTNQLPPGQRVTGADSALADLRQVRVAVSSDAVCVAWDFGAPVEQPVSVNFWAYPEDTSKERFSLAGALDPDQPPWVGNGSGGPVDGSVGVGGNSVSVRVAPGPSGQALEGPFTFAAHVGHRVRGTPERPFSYVDELNSPDGVRPAYP